MNPFLGGLSPVTAGDKQLSWEVEHHLQGLGRQTGRGLKWIIKRQTFCSVCVEWGSSKNSVGGLGSSSFTLIHSFHKPLLFLKARLLPVQDPDKIMIQLGRP